jgi:amidase
MLTARELAARLRQGELTAVEALELHLDRIAKYNPELNAIVSLDADAARRQAEAADAALRRGEIRGPLHGVPMTLKEGHNVAGLRTTIGSPAFDHVPDEDGTVAARLRAAGAIIMGHTNVPPFLADYRTENPIFGRTVNPWNTGRTPGGSSGGAAAALAAGLTPLAIVSDLAGSARQPAHCCGVYGLKASEHRVPMTGFFRPPDGGPRPVRIMGSLGPMARDLDDLGLALSLIAGPDGQDSDVPPVPLGSRQGRELSGVRLAVAPALPGTGVQRELRQQVERVAAAASDAGAKVEERLPEVDWAALHELYRSLLWTVTGVLDPASDLPDEQRTLAWYLTALERRDRFIASWEAFFADVDALLLPPAMTAAFAHDAEGYHNQGHLLVFANLTGLPGLVAPAGFDDDGLPVGIQLVGPRWSEPRLLDIAHALERAGILPGFQPPPGY